MEGQLEFQQSTSINVKVDFREDIRRFNWVISTLAALRNEISKRYGLDSESRLVLKYKDEEADLVTLTSEEDLTEAIRIVRKTHCGILKLRLVKGKIWGPVTTTETSTAACQPAAQVPPSSAPSTVTGATPSVDAKKDQKRLMKEEAWKLKAEARLLKKAEREAHKAEKDQERKEKNEHDEKVHHRHHHYKSEEKARCRLDKHAARFVKDVGLQEGAELAPGSTFVKTWRFRNEGGIPWPEGCSLVFVSRFEGDRMGAPESVPVPSAAVNEEVDVSVTMIAPTEPGRYAGFWRLTTTEGRKFGHRVRVLIHVVGSSSSSSSESEAEEQKTSWGDLLAQLEGLGFTDKELNLKMLHRHNCDISKVVACLLKKKERKEKKEKKEEKKDGKKEKKHDKAGKKTPKK